MPAFYSENSAKLSLLAIDGPNTGFRPGQLGALHSSLAHFSANDDPAILCLPTGYGKTAVMMALPYLVKAMRTLVVEPSNVLRSQSAGHFKVQSTLRRLGVLPADVPNPKVTPQKGRPATADEWEELRAFDVVISTPQSTSPKIAPDAPADLFDLIIFDEAHHAPAETWRAYLSHFTGARFVFLTATPFRRDKKAIPGKLAYNYPVSKASTEKAFGRVVFKAAPVRNDQDEDEIDRSIVRVAARQLAEDKAAGFDHRLFARAATISSAPGLVDLYAAAGVKTAAIHSHISRRQQDEVEANLLSGELDGVVCVDMFGEGYDFPKLKIAALHAPHRSLVPTLQFIGRFARTTDSATGDATLVSSLARLREANAKLFEDGVDISLLIDTAAQGQIAQSEKEQAILTVLRTKQQAESDYDAVSPLSLELYAHARIYSCSKRPDFNAVGAVIGKKLKLAKQWLSNDGFITLLLTVDHSPPNWATSDVLVNVRHDAFLLAYNSATKLCFVGSTRRTERLYLDLIDTVCKDGHRPLSYDVTRRAIAGLKDLRFYNVGLRNTALNTQGESYRVLTGPRAERAVTPGDGRAFVQGHFYGSGVDGENKETIGASSSSRIWSNRSLTVAEYLDWTTALNHRLNSDQTIASSQLDLIQHATVLTTLPDIVIAAGWNKTAYRHAHRVRLRDSAGSSWRYCQVTDLEIDGFAVSPNRAELRFVIHSDDTGVQILFRTRGGSMFEQQSDFPEMEVMTGLDDWVPLAAWLSLHPPVFYGGDKSSFQGVNLMKPPTLTIAALRDEDTVAIDWSGCAIEVEFEGNKAAGKLTVHQHLERHLMAVPGLEVLIYDHRSGEAADFIAVIAQDDGRATVSLYHCKGAGGAPSGGRVGDVYEVAGQLLKSIAYCDAAVIVSHVEHRISPDRHKNPSRFLVGDFAKLQARLTATPADKLNFEIHGVQPGISKRAVDEHLADLMSFGLDYVQRGGAAGAKWLISG